MATKDNPIALLMLARAHSPESTARIYTEKVKQRPLHLKPTEALPNAQLKRRAERARKLSLRKKKLRPAPLSARKKRSLGLYEIPKSAQKYSIYAPLHMMWIGYIQELLWDGKGFRPVGTDAAAKLCGADFHGAEVEVVRSRCVSRVGVQGIVVKDSKHTFEIVTESNQVKVVPKEHTMFRFCVPPPVCKKVEGGGEGQGENGTLEGTKEKEIEPTPPETKDLIFELHGDQFIYRAVDRANRKFKSHFLPDL